ncbi:MAG: hypothetical protein JWQ40_3321 [Segetibacter sp.]|jgi:hypothetical protein|nr:hypothetical protein [Segetibacter sp.]
MPLLPKFDKLDANYPTTSDYKRILREINPALENDPAFQNTCAMRVSMALNACAGHEIPRREGLLTVRGVDRKRYAVRVKELKNYLKLRYSLPFRTLTATTQGVIDNVSIKGLKGIIAFDVTGWGDASGHFTLWNGEELLYSGGHDYFNLYDKFDNGKVIKVSKCSFWKCP